MQNVKQKLSDSWYKPLAWWAYGLLPLSALFSLIIRVRYWLYQKKLKAVSQLRVPVIIVGNITVGGTGKTPLVIYLARLLVANGYRPGIVSRGYGGQHKKWCSVTKDSEPRKVGDEALLLFVRTHCPVIVGSDRVTAAKALLTHYNCDIILSDDGLQHYALARDIEIAVIDGIRRFGNGFLLPVGPLREPIERLSTVDFVITNGENIPNGFSMELAVNKLYNLQQPNLTLDLSALKGKKVHAVAGIGHPQRFFTLLQDAGLNIIPHTFADHHAFKASDVDFQDQFMVIMTEKDAIKCKNFKDERLWCLPVTAKVSVNFADVFIRTISKLKVK